MGLIYRDLQASASIDLGSALSNKAFFGEISLNHGWICTPIDESEVVGSLVRTIEQAKADIDHQSAVTMPTAHTPSKMALWLAGILLAF